MISRSDAQLWCILNSWPRVILKVATDECAGIGDGAAAGLKMRVPQMPCVDHVRPNLQSHGHLGGSGHGREACGVLKQGLGRPHLDERWREAFKSA